MEGLYKRLHESYTKETWLVDIWERGVVSFHPDHKNYIIYYPPTFVSPKLFFVRITSWCRDHMKIMILIDNLVVQIWLNLGIRPEPIKFEYIDFMENISFVDDF